MTFFFDSRPDSFVNLFFDCFIYVDSLTEVKFAGFIPTENRYQIEQVRVGVIFVFGQNSFAPSIVRYKPKRSNRMKTIAIIRPMKMFKKHPTTSLGIRPISQPIIPIYLIWPICLANQLINSLVASSERTEWITLTVVLCH